MTSATLPPAVRVPDAVLVRTLGAESVLLNLDSESYFGLDDVGTRMWAAVTSTSRIEDALAQLLQEFEVDAGRLRADLADFLARLVDAGLLHVVED